MQFSGMVYRAHKPEWSFSPLSGAGASYNGGRFNPVGTPALYTALSPITALSEYHQKFPSRPQPTMLCAYKVDCQDIVDLRDPDELKQHGIDASDLSCAWEYQSNTGITPPSWEIAITLIKINITGIIVPSFAEKRQDNDGNLIFWKWGGDLPHQVLLIDDDDRLPKNRDSWG
ncbi:MAG: RES family NAD+ phosphorylase [Thiohalomonadales bacterium]